MRSRLAALLICAAAPATCAFAAAALSDARPQRPSQNAVFQSPSVSRLVAAAIAGDQARLRDLVTQLRSQPKARGDRVRARQLNEYGLALTQRQRYAEAAAYFRNAHRADGSDAEIAENLGYSLLRAGEVAAAEPAILSALEIAPERASAWGSLGLIYAKQGKHREGVACMLTAYGFAANQTRTLDVYSRLAVSDDDAKVRAMLSEAVGRLKK